MNMDQIRSRPVGWLTESLEPKRELVVRETDAMKAAASKLVGDERVLPVIDANGDVTGVLGQTDIAKWITQQNQQVDFGTTPVKDVANQNFVPIKEDDPIGELIDIIVKNQFDQVVVIDKNKKYRGVIDRAKLANEIEKFLQ